MRKIRTRSRGVAPRARRLVGAAVFGTVAVLGIAGGATRVAPTAHAAIRASTVDLWLLAHPAIANAIIWEFPPVRMATLIPRKFIVWPGPDILPDPSLPADRAAGGSPEDRRLVAEQGQFGLDAPESIDITGANVFDVEEALFRYPTSDGETLLAEKNR